MVLPFVYTEEEYKKLEKENKYLKSEIRRITSQRDNLKGIADNLVDENRYLEEENKKLEEDNINLISFNEHYSPEVIVKYEDRYETAYKEECVENAKLCDKMRMLEEENKSLKNELMEDMKTETKLNERIRFLEKCLDNKEKVNKSLREENKKLKEELGKFIMKD